MCWEPAGDPIPVRLLLSDALPRHWARLDEFEGSEYRRILVPVDRADGSVEIANLYEAARGPGV